MLILLIPGVGMGAGQAGSPPVVPPVVPEPVRPSGGFPAYEPPRRRTRKDISEARKRLGLKDDLARQDEAARVVADVAARQAQALQTDQQKQFEELSRQLALAGIEFESAYLQALNLERGRLIDAEIAGLLRKKLEDEELMIILMAAAAV